MAEGAETVAQLVKSRVELIRQLDEIGVSAPAAEAILTEIESLNWKIAHERASNVDEALSKAKLLAEVSGAVYPHTIEGALLMSLIEDLIELSS